VCAGKVIAPPYWYLRQLGQVSQSYPSGITGNSHIGNSKHAEWQVEIMERAGEGAQPGLLRILNECHI